MASIDEKEKQDIEFYATSEYESPDVDFLPNFFNKTSDGQVFYDAAGRYQAIFRKSKRILELGGGQGWASCIIKRMYPGVHVTATDISPHAIKSINKWEQVYSVSIDASYACRSYETKEADQSVDCVFCFAAAHHFALHEETLREIARILRPGGSCLYLHEPSCSPLLYPIARMRVNKLRSVVEEDVLVPSNIKRQAVKAGLSCTVHYSPTIIKRGPLGTVYYALLRRAPFLWRHLPCTVHIEFTKPENATRVRG